MGIVGKLSLCFEEDGATLLERVLMADGICQGNPNLGLVGALAPELLCSFAQLHKPAGSTQDASPEKIESKAMIAFSAGLGDAAKSFIVHSEATIPLKFFLQFGGLIHCLD
jgi:hypothetical protein